MAKRRWKLGEYTRKRINVCKKGRGNAVKVRV